MSILTKERQKNEFEKEELGKEFPEELEVTEEKEQKKEQINDKEKK